VIVYRIEESGDVFIQRIRHGLEDWQAQPDLDDDQA
jgi:plasmid stabilization system protein ParE